MGLWNELMLLSRRLVTVLEGRVGREQAPLPNWQGCWLLQKGCWPHSQGKENSFLQEREGEFPFLQLVSWLSGQQAEQLLCQAF